MLQEKWTNQNGSGMVSLKVVIHTDLELGKLRMERKTCSN
jgi:hypothetical protein